MFQPVKSDEQWRDDLVRLANCVLNVAVGLSIMALMLVDLWKFILLRV